MAHALHRPQVRLYRKWFISVNVYNFLFLFFGSAVLQGLCYLYDMHIFSQLPYVVKFFMYIVLRGEVVNLKSNPQHRRQGLLFICPVPSNL